MARRWNVRAAVRAANLAGKGLAAEVIAEAVGRSVRSVQCSLTRWGCPPGCAIEAVPVTLPPQERRRLEQAAATRGMAPAALLQLAVHIVLRDDLVSAIVDDPAARRRARLAGSGGLSVRAEIVRKTADIENVEQVPGPSFDCSAGRWCRDLL